MPTTINGTTGVSQVQDNTITSAKIIDGTIVSQDLLGGNGAVALTITSTPITPLPAANTTISYSHGLGIIPADVIIECICLTAELGYAVGDVVIPFGIGTTYTYPFSVAKNATSVFARTANNVGWQVVSMTTGVNTSMTLANWSYRFKIRTA